MAPSGLNGTAVPTLRSVIRIPCFRWPLCLVRPRQSLAAVLPRQCRVPPCESLTLLRRKSDARSTAIDEFGDPVCRLTRLHLRSVASLAELSLRALSGGPSGRFRDPKLVCPEAHSKCFFAYPQC